LEDAVRALFNLLYKRTISLSSPSSQEKGATIAYENAISSMSGKASSYTLHLFKSAQIRFFDRVVSLLSLMKSSEIMKNSERRHKAAES
jgi:hypothetical protein